MGKFISGSSKTDRWFSILEEKCHQTLEEKVWENKVFRHLFSLKKATGDSANLRV